MELSGVHIVSSFEISFDAIYSLCCTYYALLERMNLFIYRVRLVRRLAAKVPDPWPVIIYMI